MGFGGPEHHLFGILTLVNMTVNKQTAHIKMAEPGEPTAYMAHK